MSMARRTVSNSKVAVAYLRCSTEKQDLSPDSQRAAIEAWATAEGVTVIAWHTDIGVSGGAPIEKRPALLDALAALELNGAGSFVVAKRDRLARDTMNAIAIEGLARKAGARIVSAAGEGTDSDDAEDPAAFILRRIIDVFAEYERLVIKARTRAGLRVKKARGQRTGKVPYGFKVAEDGRTLVADERERAIIARAHSLRASGMKLKDVAATLAAEGLHSRSGKPYAVPQVFHLLRAAA